MTLTQIFAKVLNMSLTASLVIVLVIAARFVLRKSPKVFSYALWAVVLFRLLCPVSLPSPVSPLGLLDAPVAQTEGITTTVEYIPYKVVEAAEENTQPDNKPQNTVAQDPTLSQQTKLEPLREPLSAAEIITYVWLAGIAVMVIVGVGSYLRFRKHLTGAMQVKDNIYLVDHIDSAFVAGLIRPKVYLPSDIPLKQMGYIIAHEQYHIRRLDHVTKHLSFAALCIHWFNPFVWAAFILSGKDLEMSCDEAVIKRLGEGIRADYSASLLSLATSRRIIAGTPLAFGEGDTKGRINNMAKWKQPKKWVSIVTFILCFTILTACAANPTQNIVTSKNDGAFEENIQQTAPSVSVDEAIVNRTDSFTSLDGSVEFTWNVNQTLNIGEMPVIEAVPYFLTGEDAERVVKALFGDDVVFYDLGPESERQLSKSELQEKITLLSQYTNAEDLHWLRGEEETVDHVKAWIEVYTQQYETAPDKNTYALCDWTLKPATYYDENDNEKENTLIATTSVDGLEYIMRVNTYNQGDYQTSSIGVSLGDGSDPTYIEKTSNIAKLCITEEPTEEQIEAAKNKAQSMLDQMGMGEFTIARTFIEVRYFGDTPAYQIWIEAEPVYEGNAVLYGDFGRSYVADEAYNSEFPVGQIQFFFSANCDLISFVIHSLCEVKEVKNTNVATLSMAELMEKAQNHMALYDAEAMDRYTGNALMLEALTGRLRDSLDCKVEITELEYGLARFPVPNSDSFYYAPAVVFFGTIDYCDPETGEVVTGTGNPYGTRIQSLVVVNAVDGTIY